MPRVALTESGEPPGSGSTGATGAPAIAALATIAFLLPWWNRFLGVTLDGYFPHYGSRILAGEVPYRDFFLHLPPLHALGHAALEGAFGRHLVMSRAAGALARVALAGLLAAWLARRFRPGTAAVAALAAVWLASGDDTEILDLYNHHALLVAVAAGWCASSGLAAGRRRGALWLAAGLAAGIALWTKQTIGLAVSLAVPLARLAVDRGAPQLRVQRGRDLLGYAAGWALPSLLLGGWLALEGALGAFARQVFSDAAASKGSLWVLLLRPLLDPFELPHLAGPAALGAAVALLSAGPALRGVRPVARAGPGLAGAALAAAVALALGHLLAASELAEPSDLRWTQRLGVFVTLFGLLPHALVLALEGFRNRWRDEDRELLWLLSVSGACAFALALSWPGGEAIAAPGLAVVVGLSLEAAAARRGTASVRRAAPALAAAFATVAVIALKMLIPFDFVLWREPSVARAMAPSAAPELAGLELAPATRDAVDGVLATLDRATRPGEAILAFPAQPLFYWLADRPPATFAAVHWLDVTPDRVVAADLARTLAAPPVAVVRMHLSARMLEVNRGYFRSGERLALADFQERLIELLDDRYELAFRSHSGGRSRPPLEVWVRDDRARELGGARPEG